MKRFPAAALITLILVSSFLLKLNHLGHGGIKALDESFHAVVAKNLIKHPLKPTLYDEPYLPYDYRDWQNNHVWLHKPIVPLWQMAASMALFGVNTLALRLPSAILATVAVWLTYAIGVRLLDRRAALIAAALQAFNPGITSLVHGYVFSDHIDIAFLFWVELAVYFLVRAVQDEKRTRWLIAAGITQGIAYLSKSYPAFVVTGIALVIALLPLARRLPLRGVVILIAATLAAIAAWTIWCLTQFPQEFIWEQFQVLRHLNQNVEGWAAPWDRLIFDFSLRIYQFFYPAITVATLILTLRAWRERNTNLVILLAWGLGVLIPHTLATSKTMTATLIGWPAMLLLLGGMISRASRGDGWCLGGWFGATALGAAFALLYPDIIPKKGWGYPDPPHFARIMRDNIWILWHVLTALAIAAALGLPLRGRIPKPAQIVLMTIASLCTIALGVLLIRESYRVTRVNRDRPAFAQLGAAIRAEAPDNAVLLLEPREKAEHIIAMFHTDRTVYAVNPSNVSAIADKIRSADGIPLLVTERALPLPLMFDEPLDGLNVYLIHAEPITR